MIIKREKDEGEEENNERKERKKKTIYDYSLFSFLPQL